MDLDLQLCLKKYPTMNHAARVSKNSVAENCLMICYALSANKEMQAL
jgi:hypothetical protein